jgi:predicted DNA-binding ribbon-helix-helix protein
MEVTVRKNFVFDKQIATYLEEIAKDAKQSMTALVQEMIEERYKQIKVKKRLKAFNRLKGSATGLFTDASIQSIKANREL